MSAVSRRRAVAVGALAAMVVAVWLLAFRDGTIGVGDRQGAAVQTITIESDAVGESLPVRIVEPDEIDAGAPLLVFLPGRLRFYARALRRCDL